jgi:hypothetical protein
MELKRKFIKGVMNKDVDERLIPDGEYIDAVNVDVANAEGSDAGTIRNVKGNSLVGDVSTAMSVVPTSPKTIGAIADEAETLIYWFVVADNVEGIYEYNENTGTVSRILESTTGQLNFSEDYYITGVNLIDGFLYWTDNLNPPRRVNISLVRTWGANSSKIDEYIDVIVAPPMHAPKIDMQTATNQEKTWRTSSFSLHTDTSTEIISIVLCLHSQPLHSLRVTTSLTLRQVTTRRWRTLTTKLR